MGLGPWYRIGLSLTNALFLAAIVETITTFNFASHCLAYLLVQYHYGEFGREPANLSEDIDKNLSYNLLAIVVIAQIIADFLLWFAVIIKGNRHFALVFVITSIVKTLYVALISVADEWGETYDGLTALWRIVSFLWGTVLFGFCIVTGIQTNFYLSNEEGKDKIFPVGQGIMAIRDFYRENFHQLAIVLLMSEIITNVHRSFHFPVTAYLAEAEAYHNYQNPGENGIQVSIATVVINSFGLILLQFVSLRKNALAHKAWASAYVIIILSHFIYLALIVIDWSPINIHSQMFNGFVFISVVHLLYKIVILYIYLKSSTAATTASE